MLPLERLEPLQLPPRRGAHRPGPRPAQPPFPRFLAPPRQHEGVNVQGGRHRLYRNPRLATETYGRAFELEAVPLDLLNAGSSHGHLPLVRGKCLPNRGRIHGQLHALVRRHRAAATEARLRFRGWRVRPRSSRRWSWRSPTGTQPARWRQAWPSANYPPGQRRRTTD